MIPRLAALAFLLMITSTLAGEPVEPDLVCLTPAAADTALREGRVMRFTEIARRLDGEIVRAELCDGREGPVYRVTLFGRDGRVRRVLADARTGRLVYDGR